MSDKRGVSKIAGLLIGVVLVVVAVYSVFFVDWRSEPELPPPPVRPLKTLVIGAPRDAATRNYPGKVRANEEVDLAFQVAGPLVELPVKKGEEVEKGRLLARLDPRDFQNNLDAEQARLDKATSDLEKMEQMVKAGAGKQRELTEKQAAFKVAQANVKLAAKALDDTQLHAPFTGIIANTFVNNFENVQAKQAIVSLQDILDVEIEVYLPEERIVTAEGDKGRIRWVASFEFLPGRSFDVEVKEYTTEADPLTQTFAVNFVMPAPTDVIILPGMTATVTEHRIQTAADEPTDKAYAVPLTAVPVDTLGNYFVWRVDENSDGTATVARVDVKVGEVAQDHIYVTDGIAKGDRIATAGVHVLREGQKVRLMKPDKSEGI